MLSLIMVLFVCVCACVCVCARVHACVLASERRWLGVSELVKS